ncbi:MAG: 3,4-dihydroxy-2-butanone-4-phosphate synthase [Halobacteria archaeon]|nr:3,4-dihydroxy-2-butanone-4-phosphate synthase [Halobacteria archaeon]
MTVRKAMEDLRKGRPVLIYDFDDREGETDIVYAAESIDYKGIARLRNDAGGLICTAVHPDAAEALGLPFLADALDGHPSVEKEGDLDYDTRSSFSLWVNHKSNYTGVTDKDRAKTARALAEAVKTVMGGGSFNFAEEFRTPGHMAVLRAAEELLDDRRGQTEMSVKLVQEAGLTPAAVVCEMLDGRTGEALSKEQARLYAEKNDLVFLEGKDLLTLSPQLH